MWKEFSARARIDSDAHVTYQHHRELFCTEVTYTARYIYLYWIINFDMIVTDCYFVYCSLYVQLQFSVENMNDKMVYFSEMEINDSIIVYFLLVSAIVTLWLSVLSASS